MNDIKQYVPLIQCASFAADEDKSEDLDRYWLFAFRGYADIYRRVQAEPKTARLPVSPNGTVTIPSDSIKWTKIGLMGDDGKIVTLALNNTISNFRSNNPARLEKLSADVQDPIQDDLYFLNYFNGTAFTQFGCNNSQLLQPAEFKVDETNNIIVLPPSYAYSDIYMEYLSSPERDKDYMIEQCCQEAVIAFIRWKAKTGPEVDYYNRLREARRMLAPIRLQVINQVIRENHGWKIKA